MDEDQQYNDPIVSIFGKKNGNERLDKEEIRSWIEGQRQSDDDIRNCEKALEIYTDLLKTEFYITKSWDIKTLIESTMVKFELSEPAAKSDLDNINDESFYRDISTKCIEICDKLSIRLQKKQFKLDDIREYMSLKRGRVLDDSSTFLLELWFTCRQELSTMRHRVAGIFIRSKALIVDHELESYKLQLSDPTILNSYRSFMKILIQQIQDSEASSDQSLFDECLQVFLDIEAMYNSLKFNLLLDDNESLQDSLMSTSQRERALESGNEDQEYKLYTPLSTSYFNEHSRSSSISGSTDFSLMMDRTNLSRELPSLLTAFNNAKRMEQEIENVRTIPLNLHASHNVSHHEPPFIPSSSLFRSKLNMMNQQQDSFRSFTSSATTAHSTTKGSDILKNLYGTGNGLSKNSLSGFK